MVESKDIHGCIPEFFYANMALYLCKIISDYEKCVTLCGLPALLKEKLDSFLILAGVS